MPQLFSISCIDKMFQLIIRSIIFLATIQSIFGQIFMPERRENLKVPSNPNLFYRLPNNTIPESYDISLTTNVHLGEFGFNGIVKIQLATLEKTTNITIQHRELTINTIKLNKLSDPLNEITTLKWDYDDQTELLVIPIDPAKPLEANEKFILEIHYNGVLRTDEAGFYRSSYINANGVRRWLATTQFEQTDARHAFPCYDEPAKKANYVIRITHDKTYSAISNMPATRKENKDDTVTTEFEETPKTSSYLIAFVVSDFSSLTNNNKTFEHRTFAKTTAINETYLALEAGEHILNGIADYLNVPFSLPKMDQAAIPDFAAGAMENWGLVTYRESAFFWNEQSKFRQRETIYSIIAHEFGHQWFGNLVSPKWWTYIWLNEGFANYFGNKGVDLVYPDMKLMDLYVTNNVQNIMNYDAHVNTRPMTHYVEDPLSVSLLFDYIAYGKSGSVIRMFSHAFTEETFKKGLKYYLDKMKYSDAAEEDLFEAMTKAVKEDKTLAENLDVATIMLSWTRHRGFPILYVTVQSDGVITVVQEQYLGNASLPVNDHAWWVPYNFVTASDTGDYITKTSPDGWLNEKVTNITQSTERKWGTNDWVVFNKEHAGYYRVKYDDNNYKLIADALAANKAKLHHLTKTQLLGDVVNFISAKRMKYEHFLSLARLLEFETEYTPWAAAINTLSTLDNMLQGTDHYSLYEEYFRNLLGELFKSTGVNDIADEPHLRKYSRLIAVEWACAKNLDACVKDSTKRLKELIADGTEFHQNIRNNLFCASLRGAEEKEFIYVWSRLLNTEEQTTRNMLLESLSCSRSKALLNRYIRSSLNSTNDLLVSYRKGEEYNILLNAAQSGVTGFDLVNEFIVNNVNEIKQSYTSNQLQSLVDALARRARTTASKEQLQNTINKLGDSVDGSTVNAIIENYEKWKTENIEGINTWLHENVAGGSTMLNVSFFVLLTAIIVNFMK